MHVHLARSHEATDNQEVLRIDGVHRFALSNRKHMVDLYAYVACGVRACKLGERAVLERCPFGRYCTGFHADIHGSDLAQSVNCCLQCIGLTFYHEIVVRRKRSRIKSRDENGLWALLRHGNAVVWTLLQVAPHACLQEEGFNVFTALNFGCKVLVLDLLVGFDADGHHLTAVTAFYRNHLTAYRRNEQHRLMTLVAEQGATCFYDIAFAYKHFGLDAGVVVWNNRKDLGLRQRDDLLLGLTFHRDVQTLCQFDYFVHNVVNY